MICHVGAGKLITDKEIVGIFDLDGAVFPAITSDFLKKAEKSGRTEAATDDLPRSFVLTEGKYGEKIIFSRLSPVALSKRAEESPDKYE